MQKWNGSLLRKFDDIVDGNASVGTSVVVRNTIDNTLAVVYDVDDTNSVQKNNPFVTDDFGRYSFFAPNGKYTIEFGDGSDSIDVTLVDNITHGGLLGLNGVGGHDSIYERKTTVAQIESGVFSLGSRLTITDRPTSSYIVEVGNVYDGYTAIYAGPMRVAKLQFDTVIKAAWFGAVSNSSGVRETETTAALNELFAYANVITGIQIELDGRYFTNAELVFPLCTDRSIYAIGLQTIKGNNSIITHSHSGVGLRIKTGTDVGNRNYSMVIEDLYIKNNSTIWTGTGIHVEGAFSPTFRRVISSHHNVEFSLYTSSEVMFEKCVAHTCKIGIRGDQLANPNGVGGNDYSVITYDQFVCFGFEDYGIYVNGGGVARHMGGTIASPGLAAKSAIHYEGECRDINIQDVIMETQNNLAFGVISFTGTGLKRSIKISGVTQEVVGVTGPSTLIVANDVENITIDNVPFNVASATFNEIKYAIIDGAKQVTLINNARTYEYLNKIDLYDVETLVIDNYQVKGRNADLAIRRTANAEPISVSFDSTYSTTPVLDNTGKSGATCLAIQTIITREEYNRIIGKKLPLLAMAKVLTSGTSLTTQIRNGATNKGQRVSTCKAGRWKTHLFEFPTNALTTTTDFTNGVRFSGISAASWAGVLSNDGTFYPELYVTQADITGGITGWPIFSTIYNISTTPADPIGWVNTLGGVKIISAGV